MATDEANNTSTMEPLRPLANFPPSIWGEYFLSFSLNDSELEGYAKAIEQPKEDIRRLIVSPTMDSNTKLRLINSVYRLGLKYLFLEEIEGELDKLFKEFHLKDYEKVDLCTTSINFQVFRQYGYKLPCDVFDKFKDCESGKFKEYITSDVMGILSLHESTQLRISGELILDEAFAFTETQLKGVVDTLEGNLARQVKHALQSPFHRGIPLVEARLYFSNYEEDCSTYDSLPELAHAHFSYLQLLHKHELQVLTRWEISAMEQLPEYTKPFYTVLFNMYTELEEMLSKEGRAYLAKASRKEFAELATAYFQEAEWRHSGYVPSFQEYMKNGLVTSTYYCFARSAAVGMGTIVTEEVFAWYESHPKILQATCFIGRFQNDVFSFKFEAERAQSVTGVDAYMKTFKVPESVAIDELMKMVENAWKEINEECLKPTDAPVEILTTILNLARIVDVIYKFNDGYTFADTMFKEYITLLLVSPVHK